jgi:hypothetical protein
MQQAHLLGNHSRLRSFHLGLTLSINRIFPTRSQPLRGFFPCNRLPNIVELLEVHQPMNFVLARKSRCFAASMLIHTSKEIICHANVQGPSTVG